MTYVPRLVDTWLAEVLEVFPAALIVGPRAVGKTTTARRLAGTVIELDDPAQAAQFRADPTAALGALLSNPGPLLLDEWQEVPEVLGAVKRAVDRGVNAGSLILTGSVRAPLDSAWWPGTGRVITIEMRPVTVLEQRAETTPHSEFLELLMAGRVTEIPLPADPPDLSGYVTLAVTGGYPPVLEASASSRAMWLDSYIDQIVLRDVPDLGEVRDPTALRRLLHTLIESTGTTTVDTELAKAADINVKTLRRQERMLEDLRIVTALPPWHTNRLTRLIKQRKRYAVDTGLAAALLETDVQGVLADGDLMGRMLETFVLAQLCPLIDATDRKITAHHLRQQDGRREVDVLLEAANGQVVGIEIKASAGPSTRDARHLAWLRDELGERFTAGIVLHTGAYLYRLCERIHAVPIAALWGESYRQ